MSFTLTSHDLRKPIPKSDANRAALLHKRIVQESFGWPQSWSLWQNVPMTPWGYPMSAAPFARGASGTPIDRLGGRDIPLYWNEVDLRGFRVLSKFVTDTNQFGKGFKNRLVDYHIRKGFGWQACRRGAKKTAYPTMDTEDPLIERAQKILDSFRDMTQWPLVSREAYERLQVDGEALGRFGVYDARAWFRFVAADQIGNPSGDTTSPQSFGIETDPNDVCDAWAYHVWDTADYPAGGEWVDAEEIVHIKANVRSDVKRGLPSFFPVQDNLDTVRKLLSNMLGSAQKMASVAWREKFPTASATQVQQMIPLASAMDQIGAGPGPYGVPGYPGWNGGINGFQQGEVIKVEGNREYEEGPTAAGVANFIEAEQAALRGCAVSFGFPESIATGKIDDVNYSAALTTGAPFAVAIEGGQIQFECRWERPCALKVLDLAYRIGLLSSEERRQLDVEITCPTSTIDDPLAAYQRRSLMIADRVLSPQTAQLMEQLDPQHEAANWKAWDAANPQPIPVGPDGEPKQITPKPIQESTDSSGHKHVDSGPKGGQFTGNGGSGKGKLHKLNIDKAATAKFVETGDATAFRIHDHRSPLPKKSKSTWAGDKEESMGGVSGYANLSNALNDVIFGVAESVTGENYTSNVRAAGGKPLIVVMDGEAIDGPGAEVIVPNPKVAAVFSEKDMEKAIRAEVKKIIVEIDDPKADPADAESMPLRKLYGKYHLDHNDKRRVVEAVEGHLKELIAKGIATGDVVQESTDSSGHVHKDKGPGGGQFAKTSGNSGNKTPIFVSHDGTSKKKGSTGVPEGEYTGANESQSQ